MVEGWVRGGIGVRVGWAYGVGLGIRVGCMGWGTGWGMRVGWAEIGVCTGVLGEWVGLGYGRFGGIDRKWGNITKDFSRVGMD